MHSMQILSLIFSSVLETSSMDSRYGSGKKSLSQESYRYLALIGISFMFDTDVGIMFEYFCKSSIAISLQFATRSSVSFTRSRFIVILCKCEAVMELNANILKLNFFFLSMLTICSGICAKRASLTGSFIRLAT